MKKKQGKINLRQSWMNIIFTARLSLGHADMSNKYSTILFPKFLSAAAAAARRGVRGAPAIIGWWRAASPLRVYLSLSQHVHEEIA